MKLDSGATVSVMLEQQWKVMFAEDKTLKLYKGKPLHDMKYMFWDKQKWM